MASDPSSTGNEAVHVTDRQVAQSNSVPAVQDHGVGTGSFPPNLTQELAHLIAASIAQQTGTTPQAGRTATPTNADLASLAAIMSGAQTTRKPLPPYRNELSSLAYSRPMPPAPLQPVHDSYPQPLSPSQPILHDDEPMPIPSTWRQPASHDEDKPFSKQLVAAGMGLAAGLVVVVPAVLWMTGSLGPIKARLEGASSAPTVRVAATKVRPIDASVEQTPSYANDITPAPSQEIPAVTTASMTKAAPIFDPGQQMERTLVHARQKVEGGDVIGAREILAGENTPSGPLLFALAETYDPNMLAAWGSRGVAADVQRARALYSRALDQGYGRALPRLDALK